MHSTQRDPLSLFTGIRPRTKQTELFFKLAPRERVLQLPPSPTMHEVRPTPRGAFLPSNPFTANAQEKQQRNSNLTTVSMTWLHRFAYLTLMQNVRWFCFLPSARDVAKNSARDGRRQTMSVIRHPRCPRDAPRRRRSERWCRYVPLYLPVAT